MNKELKNTKTKLKRVNDTLKLMSNSDNKRHLLIVKAQLLNDIEDAHWQKEQFNTLFLEA